MKKILIFLCLFFGLSFYSVNASSSNYLYSSYQDGLYKNDLSNLNDRGIKIIDCGNEFVNFVFSSDMSYLYYTCKKNDYVKQLIQRKISDNSEIILANNVFVYSSSLLSITLDDKFLFYTEYYSGNYTIKKVDLLTKSVSSFVSNANSPLYNSNYVYYINMLDNYKIYRKNLLNGQVTKFLDSNNPNIFFYKDYYLYYNKNDYTIRKKNISDLNPSTLGDVLVSNVNEFPRYSSNSKNLFFYTSRSNANEGLLYNLNSNTSVNITNRTGFNVYYVDLEKPLYCEKVQGSAPQYFTGSLISLNNNINDYDINQINNINFQFGSKNGRSNITFFTDDTLETYYYNSSGIEVTSTGQINQTFFDNNSYFSFNNFPASNISNFVRTSSQTFNKIYVSGSNFDYKLELYVNDNFVYYGKFKSNQYVDFINSFGGYNDVNAVRITPQNGYQIGGYKIYHTDFYSSYSEYVENEVCYYSNNIVTVDGQVVDLEHYNDVVENSVNNSFLSEYQTYFEKNCSNLNMFSQFTNLDCLFAKFVLWFKDLDFLKGITNFFNQIKNIFNFSANPTSSITINHFLSSNGNSTNLVLSYNYNDIKSKLVIKDGVIKNYINSVDKSGFIFINWIFYIIFIFIYFLSASFIPSIFIGIGISIYYFIDKIFNQIYLNSFASDVTSNNVFTTIFKFTIISFVFTIFFYLTNPIINNIIQINNFVKNFVSGILNYFYLILNYNSSFNIIDGINFISDKGFGFIATGIFIFLLGKVARLF